MARATPQVGDDGLVQGCAERVVVGSPAWYAWLEQTTTFAFAGRHGHFTARKEQGSRGGPYWKAYRSQAGKLRRAYLGKSTGLTLERMQAAAARLTQTTVAADNRQAELRLDREGLLQPEAVLQSTALVPLLATKLCIPRLRAALVPRPRLLERLDATLNLPLTLVSAPAGFGKTTVLSQWLLDSVRGRRAVAWLALDPADRDPLQFVRYLVAAIQTIAPAAGASTLALLRSGQPVSPRALVTPLLNDFGTLPPSVLVLDDYHVVDDQAIHDALVCLVEHVPVQVHLVIASRADPPLPLARWRARAALGEVRAVDLRFSPAEVQSFLRDTMRLDVPLADMAALGERTEGWIVGLHLTALALQGRSDGADFTAALTGNHHYIVDYLVDEVLHQQPAHVQRFLLNTSILDRLSGSLCDAVGGGQWPVSGQHMLEALERANLFVTPLDDARYWYRYHQLFADVLRYRLQRMGSEHERELHRRAGIWYEQHSLLADAIRHALAAGDVGWAARLVADHGSTMLNQGEVSTLLAWLQLLPEAVIRARPHLCVMLARALLITGQWETSERWLRAANRAGSASQAAFLPHELRTVRGTVAAIRSTIAVNRGDWQHAVDLSQQALSHLPAGDDSMRVLAVLNDAAARWLQGDLDRATECYADAMRMAQAGGHGQASMVAFHYLAKIQAIQGQLNKVAETCRIALRFAAERPPSAISQRLPPTAVAYLGIGNLLRERNELSAAAEHLSAAIEHSQRWGHIDALVDGYLMQARLHLAEGNIDRARTRFLEADELAQTHSLSFFHSADVAACRVRIWLAEGRTGAALRWIRDAGLTVTDDLSYVRELDHITLARVLIAAGRGDEALLLLQRLLVAAMAGGRMGRAIEVLVLQALALDAQAAPEQALTAIERALMIAEPEGFIRLFVDEGAPLRALVERGARTGRWYNAQGAQYPTLADYTAKLLHAFDAQSATAVASAVRRAGPLLTHREQDVLRLIAAGRSNTEIAESLVVGVSTVKKHINNLYAKLDVRRRTEAVARARQLQLL